YGRSFVGCLHGLPERMAQGNLASILRCVHVGFLDIATRHHDNSQSKTLEQLLAPRRLRSKADLAKRTSLRELTHRYDRRLAQSRAHVAYVDRDLYSGAAARGR